MFRIPEQDIAGPISDLMDESNDGRSETNPGKCIVSMRLNDPMLLRA